MYATENIRRWLLREPKRESTACIYDFPRGYSSFVRIVTSTFSSVLLSARHVFRAIPKNVGDRKVYRETINLPGIGSKILDTSVPIMWHSMPRLLNRRQSTRCHRIIIELSAFRCHQIISDSLRNVLAYKIMLLIQKCTNHFFHSIFFTQLIIPM